MIGNYSNTRNAIRNSYMYFLKKCYKKFYKLDKVFLNSRNNISLYYAGFCNSGNVVPDLFLYSPMDEPKGLVLLKKGVMGGGQ